MTRSSAAPVGWPGSSARSTVNTIPSAAPPFPQCAETGQPGCRAAALPIWLINYNTTSNHSAIGNRPPISRIRVRNDPRQNN